MLLLQTIQKLEGKSKEERFQIIIQILKDWDVEYFIQEYATGKNILVNPPNDSSLHFGVSTSYDVVPNLPEAKNNYNSIAISLELIRKTQLNPLDSLDVTFFFFDEEAKGQLGSKAYTETFNCGFMVGLFNLKWVGMGDQLLLWPISKESTDCFLKDFEEVAKNNKIKTQRMIDMDNKLSDHSSFINVDVDSSFTITTVSKNKTVANNQSIHSSENSLKMVSNIIWETLLQMNEKYVFKKIRDN